MSDARLDGSHKFVLGNVAAVEVADAHNAAYPCSAVGRRWRNLRGRELFGQRCDPHFELELFFEELEKSRVVGDVAVEAGVAHPLAHPLAAVGRQVYKVRLELLVAAGRDQQGVVKRFHLCSFLEDPVRPLATRRVLGTIRPHSRHVPSG
jgi:hypothetical protein